MKVFLTGGAGFIGSAFLVEAMRRGWSVTVVDAFEPTLYERARKEENLAWARAHGDFTFHEVDIRDREAIASLLAEDDFDLMVHLAAVAGVRPSIEHAPLYYDINVTGTSVLLEEGRAHGIERFVLASSSSVYGGNEKTPFAETDPVDRPISPYAASKLALEIQARTFQHLHGGDLSCLRFFTVYGPRQRPEMAIHKFVDLMARGEPIPMFGDGTTGRDYTYIDDIVAGIFATIDHLDGFRVYNLGGDDVILLRDLIATIGEVVGVEPTIERLPMQPGDVFVTNADLTRARAELGYDPKTSLRHGIENLWRWYQARQG